VVDVCLVCCYGHGCSGRSRRRSVMNGDAFTSYMDIFRSGYG